MAIGLSKLFMRAISQNQKEDQTGISLWTLEDIQKAQEKQRELNLEAAEKQKRREGGEEIGEDEDEYGDGWISDAALAEVDLDDL
jgi:DNA excision repair protein ERCC-2